MTVRSGQNVTVLFNTANPQTGVATDADSLPVGTLYVNGTANAAAVTVTNVTTGVYKAATTLPALVADDIVSLRISATVAGLSGEGVVWQDTIATPSASDIASQVDTVLSASHGSGLWGTTSGSGTGYYSDTVLDDESQPLDGVRVVLCSDATLLNDFYQAYTNALGVFEMHPDPGVYYLKLELAGYDASAVNGTEVTVT